MPQLFSVPLLQQAKQVYEFLEQTAKMKDLDDVQCLGYIIHHRYLLFMDVLGKHLRKSKELLLPAIDGM